MRGTSTWRERGGCGDAGGMGTAPARCSPTPCRTPLLQPCCRSQRCSCTPGREHGTRCHARGPAAGQESWVPWGNSARAAQHRHRGVRQSWRCAAQLGHKASIQAHSGNLPNARLAGLGLTGCPWSLARKPGTGSTAGPRRHPVRQCPAAGRLCSGRTAGAGDAAEQGWEGEGCRRRWWHSGTAGRCHSNTSCVPGPAGIGEGCVGDSTGHRPGIVPIPARRSEHAWSRLG